MKYLRVLLSFWLVFALSLIGCSQPGGPEAIDGDQDDENYLVHSIVRTQETFSDDVMGLRVGEQVPAGFQEGKNLVVLTDQHRGNQFDLLLALIRNEWTDKVTIVSREELSLESETNWEVAVDPQLIAEMKTNIFPALYVTDNGVVVHRVLPALSAFGIRILEGLRGSYANATGFAQMGEYLPPATLELETGELWDNRIQRNSIFVIVDTSCFVCEPAVEWAASLGGLDADTFLVITDSNPQRIDNGLYLQQQYPELMPGEISASNRAAEEQLLADFVNTFGNKEKVLIDRTESIFSNWGVISWPSVIVTDKEGRVVEKMLLSWGRGRMDGIRMAYPTETVEGALARLPR